MNEFPARIALSLIATVIAGYGQITVTTLSDELDTPSSDGEGTSLREAIRDASPGGVITFDPTLDGGLIQLSGTGQIRPSELAIDKALTIDASSLANGITIDGGSNGDSFPGRFETRCFYISSSQADDKIVNLRNLTMQNGADDQGGNIFNNEILSLDSCRILGGTAFGSREGNGGGIFSDGGSLTLTNCTNSGNSTREDGGGIYCDSDSFSLKNCIISNNRSGPDPTSPDGGGIYTSSTSCSIEECSFFNNESAGHDADGGGVFNYLGSLVMKRCTFSFNRSLGDNADGSAITTAGGSVQLENCTISNNHTSSIVNGGAILNWRGDFFLTQCTIVENTSQAGFPGGIIGNHTELGELTSTTVLDRCIIRGNDFQDVAYIHTPELPGFVSLGNNIVGTGNQLSIFDQPGDQTGTETPILLSPLGNYGGPTQTHLPLPGSPATNAAILDDSSLAEDQRKVPRDAFPDIGSTEFTPTDLSLLLENYGDESDVDGDGIDFLVELAIGTDPFSPDAGSPRAPSISFLNGNAQFNFGYPSDLRGIIELRAHRSTDLFDFSEVLLSLDHDFDLGDFDFTGPLQVEIPNPYGNPKAFFRLEADLQ